MGKNKPLGSLWMRTDRINKDGECQILLRYFSRKYVFIGSGIYCKPDEWDSKKGVIKGSGRLVNEKNYRLTKLKEECDRKILAYDGEISPVVIEKLLKNQASGEFFECARQLWEDALESKTISIHTHKVRQAQIISMAKWAEKNGYKGMTIKEMASGGFIKEWYGVQVKRMTESSIYTYMMTLMTLCRMMRDREMLSSDDIENMSRTIKSFKRAREYNEVAERKENKWLEKEEVRRLEEYDCEDDEERRALDVFLFSIYTCGLRISDILTLEWTHITEDWHIDKYQVKTKNKHKIAPMINDKGRAILERYRDNERFVFGYFQPDDAIGGKEFYRKMGMIDNVINRALKRIGRDAGIENLHPHKARHTATVMLLSSGMDTTTVAYLLGHTNTVQIEKTYGDYLKEFKRSKAEQAAAILNEI